MGKKQTMQILKGSLKSHWVRYITEMHINCNMSNLHSVRMSMGLLQMLEGIDSKFIQPGFQYSFNQVTDSYKTPSILDLKWVNGYQRKYNMAANDFESIRQEVLYINDLVECERNMKGQEDELEDDA